MSTTVSSPSISAAITATLKSGAAPAIASSTVSHQASATPTVGTGTDNVNCVYSAALTLTSGSNNDIDLTTLTDPLGNAINATALAGYLIQNNGATGSTLTIGGGTNPIIAAAESSEPVKALGSFRCEYFADGGIPVDSTHKTFRIAAGGGVTANYTLTLLLKQ